MATQTPTPPQPSLPAEQSEYPLIREGYTYETVQKQIDAIVIERPFTIGWIAGFLGAATLLMLLMFAIVYLFLKGVGIWGIDIPVGWGFAIINFVWWIGIGHAGTLISAILYLF